MVWFVELSSKVTNVPLVNTSGRPLFSQFVLVKSQAFAEPSPTQMRAAPPLWETMRSTPLAVTLSAACNPEPGEPMSWKLFTSPAPSAPKVIR